MLQGWAFNICQHCYIGTTACSLNKSGVTGIHTSLWLCLSGVILNGYEIGRRKEDELLCSSEEEVKLAWLLFLP